MSQESIVTPNMSLQKAWEKVFNQVKEAATGNSHPFRYVILGTVDLNGTPHQRTVVLRDFDEGSLFTIYTDSRSGKVSQIEKNDAVSLLFYHDTNRLQLRVAGNASIIRSGNEHARRWKNVGSKHAHSYTSLIPPGDEIDDPETAFNWDTDSSENFCILKIRAKSMEFLQLNGVKHLRGKREINQDENETFNWLAP